MSSSEYKKERIEQWGNAGKTPRGWDRWRSTTFLEVIQAKSDRAIQAVNLWNQVVERCKSGEITQEDAEHEMEKLRFDGIDSIKDLVNYGEKWLARCDSDSDFFGSEKMP